MSQTFERDLSRQLADTADREGGWPYAPDLPVAAEVTALACAALSACDEASDVCARGFERLASIQRADGGVPVYANMEQPCWPTALALLAWRLADPSGSAYADRSRLATDWLLRTRGKQFQTDTRIYGHDTQLGGWPWVEGTHSWVEPTAYAVLALRACGLASSPRVKEGIATLRDRAVHGGGWNYGNPKMFGHDLRPFPAPTGIALTALADTNLTPAIAESLDYLAEELPQIRAPISLCWGVIGLDAWRRRPEQADAWLDECARLSQSRPPSCHHMALLLLASRPTSSWLPAMEMAHATSN